MVCCHSVTFLALFCVNVEPLQVHQVKRLTSRCSNALSGQNEVLPSLNQFVVLELVSHVFFVFLQLDRRSWGEPGGWRSTCPSSDPRRRRREQSSPQTTVFDEEPPASIVRPGPLTQTISFNWILVLHKEIIKLSLYIFVINFDSKGEKIKVSYFMTLPAVFFSGLTSNEELNPINLLHFSVFLQINTFLYIFSFVRMSHKKCLYFTLKL